MYRVIIMLGILLLAVTACTLGADSGDEGDDASDIDTPIRIVADEPDETEDVDLRPTNTPAPTSTPDSTDSDGGTTTNNTNTTNNTTTTVTCTGVPAGWVNYAVVAGDTMSSIARRVNSSVNILASANCLSDPSQISVGQVVAVPQSPVVNNPQRGYLIVNPYQSYNGSYVLQAGRTVTFTWADAPSGLQEVAFTFYRDNATSTTVSIDNNPSNGASVSWVVPNNISGRIIASGRLAGQANTYHYSSAMTIRSGQIVTDYGEVQVSPYISRNGSTYYIDLNQTITLSWALAPRDATYIEFYMEIASAGSPGWTLIGTDNNPSNGASISIGFTPRMGGLVQAVAYFSSGTQVGTSRFVTVIPDVNYPPDPTVEGDIVVSNYLRIENGVYVLQAGATITLTWRPQSYNNGTLGPAGYHLQPNSNGASTLLGEDADFNDTITITWTVPENLSGRITASAREPGQNHTLIYSNYIDVISESDNGGGTTGTTSAAYQSFENGHMMWRSDSGEIWVFYATDNTYAVFPQSSYQQMPENPITEQPPANRVSPVQGFGRVWGNYDYVRDGVGWGLAIEEAYTLTYGNANGNYLFRFTIPDGRAILVYDTGAWGFE